MRLIDADAAYKAACEGADNWDGGCSPYRDDCIREEMDKVPAASPWHRVEEPPKDGQECIVAYLGPTDWIYEHATYHSDLNKALEEDIFIDGTDGFIVDGDVGYARHSFNYWMPIEPPKEEEHGN